jgi:hypothetical protein
LGLTCPPEVLCKLIGNCIKANIEQEVLDQDQKREKEEIGILQDFIGQLPLGQE